MILAGGAWIFNFRQQAQQAPIRGHIAAGRDYLAAGQGTAAEKEWRAALQLAPENADTWKLLGDYYIASENWIEAKNAFEQLTKLAPQTPLVWGQLAVAAAHLEDETTTRRAVEEALKRDANDINALGLKVSLLAREDKPNERVKILQRLWNLQPDNLQIAAQLADALTAAQKFDEARPLLAKIIEVEPDFAPAYAMRGEGAMREGATSAQLTQAEKDLQKSLQLDATQEKARALLAKLYTRQKQWPQSIAQYKELIERHEGQTIYWNDLAGIYQKAGDSAQVLAARRRVAQIAQDRDRRDALKSRLANDPENFDNNLQMGLLLLHSPQPLNADKYIAKALNLRPQDARALSAARELEAKYQKHLQAGLKALQNKNIKQADHEISRAMLLRPHDLRTAQAVQQVTQAAAQANPLPANLLQANPLQAR